MRIEIKLSEEFISNKIYFIRTPKVMLEQDSNAEKIRKSR